MTAQHVPPTPLRRKFFSLPQTRLGWWAIGLAAVSVVLFILFVALIIDPGGLVYQGLKMLEQLGLGVVLGWILCAQVLFGLAGGVVGLVAVIWRHERSGLVWLAVLGTLLAIPVFPFAAQWVLYVTNSPWYSP